MSRLTAILLLVTAVFIGSPEPGIAQTTGARSVIWDVTLIDGTGAPPQPHMAVIVQFGKIQAIRPTAGFRVPRGIQVIDGAGRYLIPGLWDMHVHMSTRPAAPTGSGARALATNSAYFLPMFVASGITGVRDMSGDLHLLQAWRDSINTGALLGPRMVITGFKLGGGIPAVPGAPFPIDTEADVRRVVQMLKRDGADFVKIDNLPAELFPALADECRKQGLDFVGHVTETMNAADASGFGQRSIEHLDYIPLSVSSEEDAIRRRVGRLQSWWVRAMYRLGISSADEDRLDIQRRILDTWSPARASALYARFAQDSTWQVPTLNGVRAAEMVGEPWYYEREQETYLPPHRRAYQPTFWVGDSTLSREMFNRQLNIVRDMNRAGVPLLAGTDSPGYERVPGFSLAEELALLVRAGLSPMQALQTATRNPARFLHLEDSLGTIEPGKAADLVLLDADPVADIRNVRQVHSVMLRGRYLAPGTLDSLRSSVRTLVRSWRDSSQVTELSRNQ